MNIREIYNFLDSISPFITQESWDNSGLNLGNLDSKINKIYIALESTKEIALNIEPNSLLITHHPLIFKPLKSLNFNYYPSNIIEILIKKNITLIALHTNFDLSHLNEFLAKNILGFERVKKLDFALLINDEFRLKNLILKLSKKLKNKPRFSQESEFVKNIALICGAGMSLISDELITQNALDCVISGDIKYHDCMRLKSLGISTIDIGHYESEAHFGTLLADLLQNANYNATILDSKNPFHTFKENK